MKRQRTLLSWSGGKDSALALFALRQDPRYEVVGLLTTISGQYRRISHHGVREELVDLQAEAVGLPLDKLYLPAGPAAVCTNEQYEELIGATLSRHRAEGVTAIGHGDLFLADLRAYRERNLAKLDLQGVFPLWGRDTRELFLEFVSDGFEAYVCCADGAHLGSEFAGRRLDRSFLEDLPADVDPCGENGEYHSFVFAGPIFRRPLAIRLGEIVTREGRHYADLLSAENMQPLPHLAGAQDIPPVGQRTIPG